ncbi:hypothetical protein NX059_010598 [Plenodomus lindquistii]|nr:hypothetical protein NX059_010598 [Plenodomus lindquistii]
MISNSRPTPVPRARISLPRSTKAPKARQETAKEISLRQAREANLPTQMSVPHLYKTRQAALEAFRVRVTTLGTYFTASNDNPTLPNTDEERQDFVSLLFACMLDMSQSMDMRTSRWGSRTLKPYTQEDLQATAWEIVHPAERLYREGPSVLDIRDPYFREVVYQDKDLTFQERVHYIGFVLRLYKGRVDAVIKSTSLHTLVGAPKDAVTSAHSNNVHNHEKKLQLAQQKKNKGDAPKAGWGKRKRGECKNAEDGEAAEASTAGGVKRWRGKIDNTVTNEPAPRLPSSVQALIYNARPSSTTL